MVRTARYLYAAVSLVFVAGVVVQVFLAGLFLLGNGEPAWHVNLGYVLEIIPLFALLLTLPARAGWRLAGLTALLLGDVLLQATMAYHREELPLLAAFHPVNAMLVLYLGVAVARRAAALSQAPLVEARRVATISGGAPGGAPAGGHDV